LENNKTENLHLTEQKPSLDIKDDTVKDPEVVADDFNTFSNDYRKSKHALRNQRWWYFIENSLIFRLFQPQKLR
jgi:hypothetical protein